MHGLKQHMRVTRSLRKAFLACSTASHGAGRSRNTGWVVSGCGLREGNVRTRVDFILDGEAVFAYVAVVEGDDV